MQYQDHLNSAALEKYAKALNQRAKKLKADGVIDAVMLRSLILDSGGKCAWCDASIVKADFEIEHVMPLTRGGSHTPDNFAVSCPDCNRRKSHLHPAKFAQQCLNRTGIKTALILRVLEDYEMTPTQQLSLFDEAPGQQVQPLISPVQSDDPDEDEPPPYIWG